jgi:hypothetical protein
MARVRISPGSTPEQTAAELATIGVTMGQRLRDGTYRAYVRKENMQLFINHINQQNYEQSENS